MGVDVFVILPSESDPDAESHLPLVRPGAGDLGIPAQRIHGAVSIQAHVGDVGTGIVEMRRIRRVERLGSELNLQVTNPELAEQSQVQVRDPRASQECSVHYCHSARL